MTDEHDRSGAAPRREGASHDHAHDHDHEHDHPHDHGHSHLDDMSARVRALETILVEKGLVDPAAVDAIVETYTHRVGPRNGARLVARAWQDEDFAARLSHDATIAAAELGFGGRQGEHMQAVFNRPGEHHVVVCTLCSCYPWSVLGLPPRWYKSPAYRAAVVRDPRMVLAGFGLVLDPSTSLRVWDSTAEMRYLVVPQRPEGTEGWSEEALADCVSRDAMIGTALARRPDGGDHATKDHGWADRGVADREGAGAGGRS